MRVAVKSQAKGGGFLPLPSERGVDLGRPRYRGRAGVLRTAPPALLLTGALMSKANAQSEALPAFD